MVVYCHNFVDNDLTNRVKHKTCFCIRIKTFYSNTIDVELLFEKEMFKWRALLSAGGHWKSICGQNLALHSKAVFSRWRPQKTMLTRLPYLAALPTDKNLMLVRYSQLKNNASSIGRQNNCVCANIGVWTLSYWAVGRNLCSWNISALVCSKSGWQPGWRPCIVDIGGRTILFLTTLRFMRRSSI